jgi:hypothetical protein
LTGIDGTAQHLISYDIFSLLQGGRAGKGFFFEQQLTDFDI